MKCTSCEKKIAPIWRDGKDYFYRQCDTCLEYVCEKCSDETDDGIVECIDCIQQQKINAELLAG